MKKITRRYQSVNPERRAALIKMAQTGAGAVIALSGMSVLIQACGGGGDSGDADDDSGGGSSKPAAIACADPFKTYLKESSSSHNHAIDLTLEQINLGASRQVVLTRYDTNGSDVLHVHWFTISAEDLAALKAGQAVTITTDEEDSGNTVGDSEAIHWHTHVFEFYCIA